VGGCITPPRRVVQVQPVYPADLQIAGIGGLVVLHGWVDIDGRVTGLEAVESPHPGLSEASIAAASQWQFTPTRLNGVPVDIEITISLQYHVD
jgi:TonB family protein